MEELFLNDIIVVHSGDSYGLGLTSDHVDSIWLFGLLVLFLDLEESILGIESRVLSEGSGDDKHGVSEALDSEFDLS